jgi:hypothetical protein
VRATERATQQSFMTDEVRVVATALGTNLGALPWATKK